MDPLNVTFTENSTRIYDGSSDGCLFYAFIINVVIIGILCVGGIIGNVLAFIVFQIDPLKTSTTFLFQGLSLTDTLLLITAIPVYCFEAFVNYTNYMWCYVQFIHGYVLVYVYPLCMVAQTATIWMTVLVAVNRYIAVCIPYQAARLCSVAKAKRSLAVVLILSFIYNIPRFFAAEIDPIYKTVYNATLNITYETDELVHNQPAYTKLGHDRHYDIIYQSSLYTIIMLAIPLLTLTILNILLIVTLNNIKRKRAVMQTRAQQQDNNVTFVLIIVVLVFTVCQTPALITQILWSIIKENKELQECGQFHNYFAKISNMLVILNSAVNFLIYFMFNSRFKQVLVQRICGVDSEMGRAKRGNSQNGTTCSQTLLTRM